MGEDEEENPGEVENQPSEDGSRRKFLQAVGAASAIGASAIGGSAVGGSTTEDSLAGAQETTTDDSEQETETTTTEDGPTPIVLGGRVPYWLGLAPAPIEGEQNPTLQLREGEQYQLIWMNLDGERHQWRIEDEGGEALSRTDPASRIGAIQSVEFEASDSMAQYRCEFHPEEMQGSVELGDGFETTETPDEGTTTAAETEGEVVDVAVGPEGDYLKFVPEEVEISVGDTVRWTFESEGHNVSAKPEADPKVQLPEGAEPFATYEGNRSFMIMPVGETFEHTFTVPGTYVYVCVPHADQGMVGRVVVTE